VSATHKKASLHSSKTIEYMNPRDLVVETGLLHQVAPLQRIPHVPKNYHLDQKIWN
jgi:hypothetical protein